MIDDTPTRALWLPCGHDFRIAHGFDQIAFFLKYWAPELICLDNDMPLLTGIQVVSMFKFELAAFPIIVVSQNPGASLTIMKEMEELTRIVHIPFRASDEWTEQVSQFIQAT